MRFIRVAHLKQRKEKRIPSTVRSSIFTVLQYLPGNDVSKQWQDFTLYFWDFILSYERVTLASNSGCVLVADASVFELYLNRRQFIRVWNVLLTALTGTINIAFVGMFHITNLIQQVRKRFVRQIRLVMRRIKSRKKNLQLWIMKY